MSNVAIPKLLQLLADRPAGDLDVVGLSLALRPSQAEIVSAIAALVGEGRLDAETLRPQLADQGVDIEAATGTDLWRASAASATASAPTSGAWIENVRVLDVAAVEAEAPPTDPPPLPAAPSAEREPEVPLPRPPAPEPVVTIIPAGRKSRAYCQQPGSCVAPARGSCRVCQPGSFAAQRARRNEAPNTPPPVTPTGADLAADLDALIERTGANPSRVSKMLFGSGNGLVQLRRAKSPKAVTVEKVRLFIQHPPADLIAQERRVPLGDRRFRENRPPPMPEIDAADRERQTSARRARASRDGLRKAAEERIDAGGGMPPPGAARSAYLDVQRARAEAARIADPVEQAKVALQRKGRTVYAASVVGGPKNAFVVSGLGTRVTPAALIAEAERVTGQSFRRIG